jgi:hypothetical protein
MLLVYVDDAILCGPSSKDIDDIIASLLKEGFDITDEGEIDDYLGVKVTWPTKDTIELRKPHLIQQILDEVGWACYHSPKQRTRLLLPLLSFPGIWMAHLFKRSGTTIASLASLNFWRSLLAQRLLMQCTSVLGLPATLGSPMLTQSSTYAGIS